MILGGVIGLEREAMSETSDVVLTRRDLTLIPWFIRLSRRARRIIRENLGWAFAYNLLAVPLAALGIISPVFPLRRWPPAASWS